MADILQIRDSVDVYLEHYEKAERLLEKSRDGWDRDRILSEAQIHATLALAVATSRVADAQRARQ